MYLIYSSTFLSDFWVDLFISWIISQMLTGCHRWAPENFGENFLEQDNSGNVFPLSEKKKKCRRLWGAAMEKRQQVTCIITHSLWEMAVCHQWYWWGDRGDRHLGSEITFICTSIDQSAKPRVCYCTERSPFVLLRSTCSSTIKQSLSDWSSRLEQHFTENILININITLSSHITTEVTLWQKHWLYINPLISQQPTEKKHTDVKKI